MESAEVSLTYNPHEARRKIPLTLWRPFPDFQIVQEIVNFAPAAVVHFSSAVVLAVGVFQA